MNRLPLLMRTASYEELGLVARGISLDSVNDNEGGPVRGPIVKP